MPLFSYTTRALLIGLQRSSLTRVRLFTTGGSSL